jgi:hypothetical protein
VNEIGLVVIKALPLQLATILKVHIDRGNMKRFVIIVALTSVLASPFQGIHAQRSRSSAAPAASPARGIADEITAAELKDYLFFIASDEMEGRDTPSRGLDTTAKFIAFNLSRWGLKPAGDNGTYFQRIALRRYKIDPEKTRAEINGQGFNFGEDFLNSQVPNSEARLTINARGQIVYVGDGWVIKAKNMDAYRGVDVKDKIMVIAGGSYPKGVTRADLQGARGVDWIDPQTYAQMHGAQGIIIIPGFQNLAFWDRIRRNAVGRGLLAVERLQPENIEPQVPTIIASPGMLNALFRGESQSASGLFDQAVVGAPGQPFALAQNKSASFTITGVSETVTTQNVVAVLEGSDPLFKNEYVALGAHYDHVGIGAPVGGDAIYNGADDDGSGTTALLAIAEALAHSRTRPKRSVLFVWHCGEEKGLWGSRYFTEHPTVPLDRVITQLNIDMIGRSRKDGDTNPANASLSGPNEIYVIGSKMMSTELGELSERVNQSYLNLNFNYRYDDPKDTNQFFFRSDHFNYARKGIPIIFYFDGEHEDYHRPTDSPDKIDYQKMEKVTRTIFMTMWELANNASRPRVDKQLPPELR